MNDPSTKLHHGLVNAEHLPHKFWIGFVCGWNSTAFINYSSFFGSVVSEYAVFLVLLFLIFRWTVLFMPQSLLIDL